VWTHCACNSIHTYVGAGQFTLPITYVTVTRLTVTGVTVNCYDSFSCYLILIKYVSLVHSITGAVKPISIINVTNRCAATSVQVVEV
jgi:hypothetical protein